MVYWWQLCLARLSHWSLSYFMVPPQILGYAHAKLDVSHDILKIYYSGLKPLWHVESEATLLNDYQIEYVNMNHQDHDEWHDSFENAYNRVASKAIRGKFGMDVVELCLTKAEMQYRTKQVQFTA
jgi:hypothetical protein